MTGLPNRTRPELAVLGTLFQPTSGRLDAVLTWGGKRGLDQWRLDFTLNKLRIPVTDAAGSGSSGSFKMFTFNQGSIKIDGARMDFTSFIEGSALDTAAGDAAFVMALGSVAADAGDGALTGTEVDICAATSTLTLSGGTTTGTKHAATAAIFDGTTTALDMYLNWSGTAATVDANSTIDVTGTISVSGRFLKDD